MKAFIWCMLLLMPPSLAQAAGCQPSALTGKMATLAPVGSAAYARMQTAACPQRPAPAAVSVVSNKFPTLSGTYGIDSVAIMNITASVSGITAGQGFPGGGSTMIWLDSSGNARRFDSTGEFVAFGAAIRNYVYALQIASHGGSVARAVQRFCAATIESDLQQERREIDG